MNLIYKRLIYFFILCAVVMSTAGLAAAQTLDSEQSAFLTLINNYRAQNGAGPLRVSVALQNSSTWMSTDMAAKNYFSHTDSLGRDPFVRMAALGYPYAPAGENLAAGYSDAQSTFNQWQTACDADSSGNCTYGHRMNMLNPSYTVMGIGRVFNGNALYRWYWTTDFGGVTDTLLNIGVPAPPPPPTPVPPTADAASPNNGAGSSQTLTVRFSSASGYTNLNTVYVLLNNTLSGSAGCWVYYQLAGNSLYVVNDAGTAAAGSGATPGSATTLQNGECSVDVSRATASGSGNTLTLTLPITLKASFGGVETIYAYAADNGNLNSGWQTLGTWQAPAPYNPAPTTDAVSPSTGAGASQAFTFTYSSGRGYTNLNTVYALINTTLSGTAGCWAYYQPGSNLLYLINDAGTAATGPGVSPGSSAPLQNNQCSIDMSRVTAKGSGNTLSLVLPVTFKAGFGGTQTLFGYAYDNSGLNSGWKTAGTWQSAVTVNPAPTADSATPNSGTGVSPAFTFKYSSQAGYGNINTVYALINSTLSANSACWIYYRPASNTINLINDAANGAVGADAIPGSPVTLRNSQCSVDVSRVSATGAGPTLSLTVPVTFGANVTSTQVLYGFAIDNANLNSGWQVVGNWKRQ